MQLSPHSGIGIMGLGKMGAGIARHLDEQGYTVVGFDPDKETREQLKLSEGSTVADVQQLVSGLPAPRVIWMMVPHGAVDSALDDLISQLESGDVVIDAGNSDYRETKARAQRLSEHKIYLVDAGVSGGPSGAREGAAIMVGGDDTVVAELSGLFADLSVDGGFQHMGPVGSGHFTKMVHNGIEYGILQSIAEGFELLEAGPYPINLDDAAKAYGNGSVIQSELIDHLQTAFAEYGTDLTAASSTVDSGGTGDWTVESAKEYNTTHRAIEAAVEFRHDSHEKSAFAGKVIQALRNQFGGHDINAED